MITKEKIFQFISEQKTAFIGSIDESGFPNIKAMLAPRKIDGNCFYFTTNTSAMRTSQYQNNPNASIYFYKRGRFRYEGVMLIGTMEVHQDQASKQMIWQEGDTMFYKLGVTDPDYSVLKFIAKSARYYCDLHTESVIL